MTEEKRRTIVREPIRTDRIRTTAGGFAFIPNGFLRRGFFVSLTAIELRLYVLLVLAADRNGLSFYHYDSLCSLLEVQLDDYIEARNELINKDLVAYDGMRFQVLSLPEKPSSRSNPPEYAALAVKSVDPERSAAHGARSIEHADLTAPSAPPMPHNHDSAPNEARARSIELYTELLASLQRR